MKHPAVRILFTLLAALLSASALFPCLVLPAAADENALPDAVITEICYNTTFKENDFGVSSSADVLEFIEIKNTSGHDLDLTGWTVTYRKEGWDSPIYGTDTVTQVLAEGGYTLKKDAFAIFAVYTKDAAAVGLRYDTPEDFAAVRDMFVSINYGRDRIPVEQFFLLPHTVSGLQENIPGTFNLDNSSTGAVVTFLDKDGNVVCECMYNAEERNKNNYSVNFMYTGNLAGHPKASEPFNIAIHSPGLIFDNQIVPLATGLTAPAGTETIPLTFMEYNVCATDSTQTHPDGSPVTMDERAAGVFSTIAKHDPDVLCLCEINYVWVDYLAANLDGEDCAYASYGKSSNGSTWGNKRINRSTWDLFNLILWKKDKYDLIDSGTFWCSKTPDKKGTFNWEDGTVGDFARGINWVILEEKESGARFFVLCQHIDAKVAQSRTLSCRLIAEKATELSDGLPVLMTGDWNCGDSSAAYAELMKSGKFADARYRTTSPENMTLQGSFNSWGGNANMTAMAPIDHCILSKDTVFVRRADTDYGCFNTEENLYASDHNATVYSLDLTVIVRREPVTEAPTEPATEPATEPETVTESVVETVFESGTEPAVTDAATAADTESVGTEADTGEADTGCASAVTGAALLTLAAAAVCLMKRKH